MKKILIIAPFPNLPGGVNNYISLLNKKLNREKFEVSFFYTGKTGFFWKDIFYPFLLFFQYYKLKRKIKEFNPDVIHLNPSLTWISIIRDFKFCKIAHKKSIPVLLFVRGWRKNISKKFQSKLFYRYFKNNFEGAEFIIVLAKDFKEELINLGINSNKIVTSSTMVESDLFFPDYKTFSEPYRILFCSYMVRYKGPYELVDAIPKVLEHEKKIKFIFMGTGPELKNLKDKIKEMKIEEYVSFIGYKLGKEKYDIFKKSHIFILPSYTEGFPNVVLEAMAAGLPIIATPVGGLNDAIMNGKNGYLLDYIPPNPIDISNKILKIVKNPNIMKCMSNFNLKEAQNKYDSKIISKKIENIYEMISYK